MGVFVLSSSLSHTILARGSPRASLAIPNRGTVMGWPPLQDGSGGACIIWGHVIRSMYKQSMRGSTPVTSRWQSSHFHPGGESPMSVSILT